MMDEQSNVACVPTSLDRAEVTIDPIYGALETLGAWGRGGWSSSDEDLESLVFALDKQCSDVQRSILDRPEAMLILQAHSLDAIFNKLAEMAGQAEIVHKMETYLKLALKAQSQCRTTLEALAELKNPRPVAFIRQQNVAQNQQVNNGTSGPKDQVVTPQPPPREGHAIFSQNELLEDGHVEWLDTRTAKQNVRADTSMETMEQVNGTENSRGQG